jgi:signal transduction histidine kinase/ActR/RegA family two-component response regulator
MCAALSRAPAAPETASPAAEGDERSLLWLRIAVGLAAVLPLAFFFIVAWVGRTDAISAAHTRMEDLARVAEEHAVRVFETNEVVVEQLSTLLRDDDDLAVRERESQLHEILAALLVRLPQLESVTIWSAQGHALASSRIFPAPPGLEISRQPYFERARQHRGGWRTGLLIEPATGEALLNVTRRRDLSDGRFGGLFQLSLHAAYFTDFYETLAKASEGVTVSLAQRDGVVIARWPREALPRSGAKADQRPGVSRKVGAYPLSVSALQEHGAALAEWRRQMTVLAAVTFPTALALVLASLLALRRTRRAMDAARRLREESEQRMRAEDALRHAQKLEALGQLTGGVAHDFNNLMSVVSNNAHLLARRVPQLAQSGELAAIHRAIDGGARLTRQLLAFSRRQALRPEILRLQEVIPEMLDLLSTTTGKAIQVTVDIAPDTPPVEVDAAELENALINLAANARDAMSGAGHLTVRARAAPPEARPGLGRPQALIDVCDTGAGISRENLDRVFEPFFTTKPVGSGTGLGLSQVYGFCAQAGGTAAITSEGGRGTTVSLFLPVAERRASARKPTQREAAISLRGRVLLVEDNAEVATAMAGLLTEFGCVVTPVHSAEEAERALQEGGERFDVVLSDIVMPGDKDGLALAFALREHYPGVSVVLMTGFAREAARAVSAGIEVMPKPCAPEDMARVLSRALAASASGPCAPGAGETLH